jgi:hypothetical protein
VNSDITVTAVVPSGAVTGKIAVTTSGGTAQTATTFNVTQCDAPYNHSEPSASMKSFFFDFLERLHKRRDQLHLMPLLAQHG